MSLPKKPGLESFSALSELIKKQNSSSQQTIIKGSFNALKNAVSKNNNIENKKDKKSK